MAPTAMALRHRHHPVRGKSEGGPCAGGRPDAALDIAGGGGGILVRRHIDTIPVAHHVTPYLALLDVEGVHVIVGQLGDMEAFSTLLLLSDRRRITGSPVGGTVETQEMLDFCARRNILPDCEMIAMAAVNEAFERLERGDVRYRFVIDMASLASAV